MKEKRTVFSGFTKNTSQNLLLDAGAFFKNFIAIAEEGKEKDTYETAKAAGKLLGATRGGGKFVAKPTMRDIPVDGVKGPAKGLQMLDFWDVSMSAGILEITVDGLSSALTASEIDKEKDTEYDIIIAKNYIELEDYIQNITYVGKLSGSSKPIIIQVYNALNTTGITLQTKNKDEAVVDMEFKGTYDADDLDSPPFKIFYPKEKKATD